MVMIAFVRRLYVSTLTGLLFTALLPANLRAQIAVPQITQAIDETRLTTLHGNTHPLANTSNDRGVAPASTPSKRMLMVLRRSDASEKALKQYIDDAHNPASPSFHRWLKPGDVGTGFGPAEEDVRQVTGWLAAHGFSVDKVHPGKTVIEFSGTTGQVKEAFHTEIHQYMVNGVLHTANSGDPQIPAALAPAIAGFASLNNFDVKTNLKVKGAAEYTPSSKAVQPQWTEPAVGGVYFALAPGDFNVQYDVPSAYTGAGYTIGIIGASNVDVGLVNSYRSVFGLPANPPQVVVDGDDPGQNGAATESYLDVEAAGSVAAAATVVLYTSASSALSDGLFTAAIRAVNDDTADALSMSYGGCEAGLGTTNLFFYQLWQQAAAQGQTVMVSAGDGGAAGCDNFDSEISAEEGLAVSGFASTPYNVAVGGTDFYYSAYNQGNTLLNIQLATYWNKTSTTNPATSLLQRIPEQPWNVPQGLNTDGANRIGIVAGSGGASSCSLVVASVYGNTCLGGYAKPSWQSGTGVPADGVRDLPDVSLFASNGYNYSFWPICALATDCTTTNASTGSVAITAVGGTSASSPAFAGIMALVDQAMKSRQGQANYTLYALAAQKPAVFHDVAVGSNKVPCLYGYISDTGCGYDSAVGGYDLGYAAGTGYDQASGLGSVDVSALISNWNTVTFKPTNTTLSLSSSSITHGQSVTVKANVTPSSGSGTPTGAVALVSKVSGATTQTGLGDLTLSAGAASSPVTSLPGGTYTVFADYSGDSVYAASQSTGSTLTVTPEASVISYPATVSAYSRQTNAYGSPLYIAAQVAPSSGSANGVPTGIVTFSDSNGGAQRQFPVNSSGVAEWDPSGLAIGTHTIASSYGGDASFNATSTPVAVTFAIGRGTAYVYVTPSETTAPVGGSVTVAISVNNAYLAYTAISVAAPSGSVIVSLGTTQQVVPLTPATGGGAGYGIATFTNLPAGNLILSAAYAGDSNWNGTISSTKSVNVVAVDPYQPTTTTLTASSPTLSGANGEITVTAVVKGNGSVVPTGTVEFLIAGEIFAEYSLTTSGTNGTATAYIPGNYFPNGTDDLIAVYLGNSYYSGSMSGGLNLNVNSLDFALNAATPSVTVPSGTKQTVNFTLTSSGASGVVTITCATSSPAISCTPPSTLPTLAALGQASTSVVITASNVAENVPPSLGLSPFYPGGIAVACVLLLWIPGRRRGGRAILLVLLFCAIGMASGCGGSGSSGGSGGSGPTPVVPVNSPPSTYSVTVTASAGGVTHNVRLTVNVQ
jgi:hypothetical protein